MRITGFGAFFMGLFGCIGATIVMDYIHDIVETMEKEKTERKKLKIGYLFKKSVGREECRGIKGMKWGMGKE